MELSTAMSMSLFLMVIPDAQDPNNLMGIFHIPKIN